MRTVEGDVSDDVRGERASEPKWRPRLRFALSVGAAAGAGELAWRAVPQHLVARTTTVGYSTVANFDVNRYTDAYFLIAFGFPAVALIVHTILLKFGPLRRRPAPGVRLLPLAVAEEGGTSAVAPSVRPVLVEAGWSLGRIALPAVAVALILSAAGAPHQHTISTGDYLGALAYGVAVVAGGVALHRAKRRPGHHSDASSHRSLINAVSRVNSLAALVVLPMLYLVSRGTTVTVLSDRRVVHYPWLPLWLVAALTVLALLLRRRWVRTASPHVVEGNVLLWVVGPVVLFVALAALPGALGAFQAFDDAQNLSTPQLMFVHGLLPWRDLFLIHGLLSDAFMGGIGLLVFGDTRWGASAGLEIYVVPAFWICTYGLVAYFCRRHRLVLLGFAALVLEGLLPLTAPQFLVVPICLVLFAMVLTRSSWPRCAVFAFAVVTSMVLVPEAAIFEIGLIPLVVAYEFCTGRRGSGLAAWTRSVRCTGVALVTMLALVVYLLATGSLSDFVSFYVEFSAQHAISNGLPVQWRMGTDLLLSFCFLVPMVLWLLTVWRVAAKFLRRSPWSTRDWTMVAAATVAILYYPKVVERADSLHDTEVFAVCLPILLLWGLELIGTLDRFMVRRARTAASGHRVGAPAMRSLVSPATLVAVIVIVVAGSFPLISLEDTPAHFHPVAAAEPPATPRLGYTVPGAVDTTLIDNLGRVIDRYAGPTAPVMDFTNQLGIIYYLLNRTPSTRYYHIEEAVTLAQQQTAVREIAQSNPAVAVYSARTFGLPLFDGIPMMVREYAVSAYLLTHYRPIVDVGTEVVMLRNDLMAHRRPLPQLTLPAVTTGLYYSSYECAFGDLFNFFPDPGDLGTEPRLTARLEYTVRPGTYQVELPPGTDLLDYHWIEIDANRRLNDASFTFSDAVGAPTSHLITFDTLPSAGARMDVMVDGCMQWHGYGADSLYLSSSTPFGTTFTLSLIR
jgi:hypothetical protein